VNKFLRRDIMKRIIATSIVIVFLSTMGCAGMSDKQQRTMTGGLIGAAGGAGIAAIAGGNVGIGAAVGAAAGGLTGYIIGEKKEQQKKQTN
jgi:osmotically inducible lipoprotein OsmB